MMAAIYIKTKRFRKLLLSFQSFHLFIAEITAGPPRSVEAEISLRQHFKSPWLLFAVQINLPRLAELP